MNKADLIKKCLIDEDAIVTYPFSDDIYKEIPVLRHKSNNKWFGLIFEKEHVLYINLKSPPETIMLLKEQYEGIITSAWHMNKIHWCKIDVNNIASKTLDSIIKISFEITQNKKYKIKDR